MAEALILDSEALNALAKRIERGVLADRVRTILEVAMQRGGLVRVPAPVLAEVCRGPRFDAAVNHVLSSRGVRVENLTESIARRAGALLAKAKLSSTHAVDAFVVATAAEFPSAVIATGNAGDIARLAASFKHIRVFAI
ncbi:MAG TPA: PIN domain-containing protein [Polyangiaceae bacterium]|nr:PIN domain-containing protein [Polyangiaceae bacterium]